MDGLKIIKHIHYHIVKKYNEGHVWCIDEIISLTLATIFPYPHKSIDHKNTPCGNIEDVCNVLNGYLGRSKKLRQEIETYSYESLKQYFNDKLVTNLSWNTKKHIVNKLNIASSIENNGFISIKYPEAGCNAVLKTYKEFEVLESSGYGNVEYMPVLQVDKQDENDSVIVEDAPANKISTPDNVILQQVVTTTESLNAKKIESTKTPNTLKTLEKTPHIEKGNNKIDLSPDVVLNPEEEKLNLLWEKIGYDEAKMPYVWKLQIPYRLYCDLKEALQSTFKVVKQSTLLNNHCEKIFVYVAEWFKWEYQPGSQNNAFTDLGVKNISGKVWESINKWQNFRYSGESNDIHLYSIYALGGLPLQAIFKNKRIDSFFKAVSDEEDANTIFGELHNAINGLSGAFSQSLSDNHGSWYRFVQSINENPESLFNDDDQKNNELVRYFYDRLENGRRENAQNAIRYGWILYTSPDSEEITGDIVVLVGKEKDKGLVTAEAIKSNDEDLYIGIECQKEILKYRRYSKNEDGTMYVGWGSTSNRFRGYIEDLSQEVTLNIYQLNKIEPGAGKLLKSFPFGEDFLVIYATEDGYSWSNLREYKGKNNTKAVIFPTNRYEVIGESPTLQKKRINGREWALCKVVDSIQLNERETSKKHNIYCEGEMTIKVPLKTSIIKYYGAENSLVKCTVDDNEIYLPLMIGIPKNKSITLYPKGTNDKEVSLDFDNVCAEYTRNRERRKLTNNSSPGIMTLCISASTKNGVVYEYNNRKYYYLPSGCLERNLKLYRIYFNNIENPVYRVLPNEEVEKVEKNYYQDNPDEYSVNDTIRFRIYSNKTEYVELDIYRPIKRRELCFNNIFLEDELNYDRIRVPYNLRDKFSLRIFDETGVRKPTDFKNQRWFKYGHPKDAGVKCGEYDIYLYENDKKNGNVLKVNGNIDQYKFYYWSIENATEPELLDVSYNASKQELTIPMDKLEGGKGMIFQSLKACFPRHYVTPFYGNQRWDIMADKTYSDDLVLKCYKIAVEHGVPFTQFPPLCNTIKNIEWLQTLFINIMKDGKFRNKGWFANLHRFANEFCFEWALLPKIFWTKSMNEGLDSPCRINRELVIKFLQSSNFITNTDDKFLFGCFLEQYLRSGIPKGSRGKIAKYMRGDKKEYQMIPFNEGNIDINIKTIELLYSKDFKITELYKKIN